MSQKWTSRVKRPNPDPRGRMNARTAPPLDHPLVNADIVVRSARTVIVTEAAAIRALEEKVDASFVAACRMILAYPFTMSS